VERASCSKGSRPPRRFGPKPPRGPWPPRRRGRRSPGAAARSLRPDLARGLRAVPARSLRAPRPKASVLPRPVASSRGWCLAPVHLVAGEEVLQLVPLPSVHREVEGRAAALAALARQRAILGKGIEHLPHLESLPGAHLEVRPWL